MKSKALLLISLLILFSCASDDIYKTKSGKYASKIGNFIAAFPTEPNHTEIDNQVGLDKFKIHLYRSALGRKKVFNVEYLDYPKHMITSMSDEQLYTQSITNYANKMAGNFNLHDKKPIEQHGLSGYSFQLELTQKARQKTIDGFITGRIFRHKNRVYTVTYVGENNQHIDEFMSSFQLIKG